MARLSFIWLGSRKGQTFSIAKYLDTLWCHVLDVLFVLSTAHLSFTVMTGVVSPLLFTAVVATSALHNLSFIRLLIHSVSRPLLIHMRNIVQKLGNKHSELLDAILPFQTGHRQHMNMCERNCNGMSRRIPNCWRCIAPAYGSKIAACCLFYEAFTPRSVLCRVAINFIEYIEIDRHATGYDCWFLRRHAMC